MNNYEMTSYITPLKYVSGRIVEYDIKSANITMLLNCGLINQDKFNYLSSIPKIHREIEVGLMIKNNNKYYEAISSGILDAKRELIKINKVDPNNIVRVANDALYINQSTDLKYNIVGKNNNIIFNQKAVYSSMLKLNNLIIFFWYNNEGINIDVKGINKQSQQLHLEYLLSIIANVIYRIERVSVSDALNYISIFYDDYINLKLPKEFYRELNSESMYRCKNSCFLISNIESLTEDIDINYNLYIIRELWSIVLELYSQNIKR